VIPSHSLVRPSSVLWLPRYRDEERNFRTLDKGKKS